MAPQTVHNTPSRPASDRLSALAPFAADLAIMAAALFAAYTLRYNFDWPRIHVEASRILLHLGLLAAIQVLALAAFGCYRLIWRFIGVDDVPRFVYAVGLTTLVLVFVMAPLPPGVPIRMPVGVVILNGVFVVGGLLLTRSFWRIASGSGTTARGRGPLRRVLLVGAGVTGNQVLREMQQRQRIRVIGFVDDAPAKRRVLLQGVRVLGTVDRLDELMIRHAIDEVIVTMVRAPRELIERVTACCERCGVPVRIVPDYYEVITGSVTVNRLREIDITDLLGREEGVLDDPSALAFFSGKRVLVTGAGGTIGSELTRQVARMGPSQVVLIERTENALYEIERDLQAGIRDVPIVPILADIGDAMRMEAVLVAHKPHIILHAAAHKHVPLMEANPGEAVRNNVLATRRLGLLAIRHQVQSFLLISTDKAVRPSSVMGGSKRLAEHVIQALNGAGSTRFCAVRFGNVLGSSGSVVPLFREQIKAGGPVTVTHPDMARYFMTTREAVRLVLHATACAAGGEIFVLDMGRPIKIRDLAEMMIRLSGLRPHEDVAITYTGIRPGEKLYEELDLSDSSVVRTDHARVFVGKVPQCSASEIERMCADLEQIASGTVDNDTIRTAILKWVATLDTRQTASAHAT
jgi:FlaA1/EpsC-like NDP-sugar epimerase